MLLVATIVQGLIGFYNWGYFYSFYAIKIYTEHVISINGKMP